MANRKEIKVPDIGDFDEIPVIEVLVAEGDSVEKEQSLLTLESDKATMDVPSPDSGTLVELKVSQGDQLSEGDVIGVIELAGDDSDEGADEDAGSEADDGASEAGDSESGESGDSAVDDSSESKEPDVGAENGKPKPGSDSARTDRGESESAAAETESNGDDLPAPPVPFTEMGRDPSSIPHASPAVRKLARELGVDLTGVEGSGDNGRITAEDLKGHVKSRIERGTSTQGSAGSGMDVAPPPEIDFARFGEIEARELSRIQKISGPNLHRNWVTIPHVTQFDEADITEMESFRKASKEDAERAGTKMTPLVFLIKAVVAGLKQFPKFNTSLSADGESLVYKKYFHVGVAVDTPNGLMVPVIRDADGKSLLELAQDLTELSGKARDGKLSREDMQGGCMTISSLGGIGGTAFTPIINAPEVAILGVSKAETKPVWNGEKFKPRLMLPLSLSYDHRVIDGADAARFTQYLAYLLGDVRRLML